MEPLMALCDLVAQKPVELTGKLTWMCNLCPQPDEMRSGSPRVTRSQLNAVLAISRFLSKGPDPSDPRPSSLALEFFRSISASFALSFWPQSSSDFSPDFSDYLGYLTLAAQLSPDFYVEIAGFVGKVVTAAIDYYYAATGEEIFFVPRAFLVSLLKHFPSIVPSDGERLVEYLLERDGVTWTSGMEVVLLGSREQVAYFEEERLEKQGIKFKLITHVMVHVMNNDQQLEQVR